MLIKIYNADWCFNKHFYIKVLLYKTVNTISIHANQFFFIAGGKNLQLIGPICLEYGFLDKKDRTGPGVVPSL